MGADSKSIRNSVASLRRLLQLSEISTPEAEVFAGELLKYKISPDEELRESYALLADIVDVSRGKQGLLRTVEGLRDIIGASFELLDIEYALDQHWLRIIEGFREDLRLHPQEADFQLEPLKKQNILAYFLYSTRRLIRNVEKRRWNRLCLSAYRATNIAVKSTNLGDERAWNHAQREARAIEVVLLYARKDTWSHEGIQLMISPEAVADAIAGSQMAQKPEFQLSTARGHGRLAAPLLSGASYSWRDYSQTPNRESLELKGDTRVEGLDVETNLSMLDESGKEQVEEGAALSEFEPPTDIPTRRAAPPGSVNRAYIFQPAGKLPTWSRSLLTAETLGLTLAWLARGDELEHLALTDLQALTFVVVLLSYAFRPELLCEAKFGALENTGESHNNPQLTYENGVFWITPRDQEGNNVFALESEKRYLYRPCSHSVTLLAPKIISRCITRLQYFYSLSKERSEWVFATQDRKTGKWIPITTQVINESLQPISATLRERIDVYRISRSAAVQLVEYGGMDELFAAIVRGEIPYYLRSQTHYSNITYDSLRRAHKLAYTGFFERLCYSSRVMTKAFDLRDISYLLADCLDSSTELLQSLPHKDNRIGSPFVPDVDLLKEYLGQLQVAVKNTEDWRLRFNLFTSYVVLVVEYLTGIRPDELKRLSRARVSLSSGGVALSINAKVNKFHREWRSLDIVPLVEQQLATYETYTGTVIQHIRWRHWRTLAELNDARQDAFFFFVTRRCLPCPVTTRSLGHYLRDEGQLSLPAYRWKLNSPRHLYRTTAVELGIKSNLIDALMGHATRGRESLGYYSYHSISAEREAAVFIASEITKLLGIEFIELNKQESL